MKLIFYVALIFVSDFIVAQPVTDSVTYENNLGKERFYKKILPPLLIAGGYTALTYFCYRYEDNHLQKEWQEHKNRVTDMISGAASPLGLSKTNFIGWGTTTGLAFITKNQKLKHTVYIWAGSMLINDAVTNNLKNKFQRHRPNTGDPFNSFDWQGGTGRNRSFPSAHTSNIFTTATVFATMYKDKKWVVPFAYGIATMVGLSRLNDNAHWASDVLAGAAVGYLSAKTMIGLDKLLVRKRILIFPQVGKKASLTLFYNF